jgi:hypothetical protein
VQVSVGGTDFAPTQIVQIGTFWQVTFVLNSSAPLGASEPLIVYLDGRSSVLANIPVANPDGSFTPLPALPSTIAR